ncbi:hypothetical protein HWX16_16480 [Ochrobactrum intermedium]|uniref:hypothetical protein n=1 Tax=Brucella intermedia TaxID=94625 RepID=UPI00159C494E|nr:hypothetical protein [Brucella intermedia]NVM41925.1 hypothetical protein [Brucella intermedia]
MQHVKNALLDILGVIAMETGKNLQYCAIFPPSSRFNMKALFAAPSTERPTSYLCHCPIPEASAASFIWAVLDKLHALFPLSYLLMRQTAMEEGFTLLLVSFRAPAIHIGQIVRVWQALRLQLLRLRCLWQPPVNICASDEQFSYFQRRHAVLLSTT